MISRVAVPLLAEEWSNDRGNIVRDERAVDLARLALSTRELAPELLNRIAYTAARYLHEQCYGPKSAHQNVSRPAILRLREAGQHIDAGLLLAHGQCAQLLGKLDEAMESFTQANSGFKEKGDNLRSETIALGGMRTFLKLVATLMKRCAFALRNSCLNSRLFCIEKAGHLIEHVTYGLQSDNS